MRPDAVEISTLGAAGTAMLMHKVLSSSKGIGQKWQKTTALTVFLLSVPILTAVTAGVINLSSAEARQIGRRIWQNECGGTVAGLTSWNVGENFASLGIGHFIWYPKGQRGPFEESFPKFLVFAATNRARLPLWLQSQSDAATPDCPWNSRTEFYQESQSSRMKELREFLAGSIDLQTGFMVERLQSALPKMVAEAQPPRRESVRTHFERVARSPNGCYALIDYVNFKGEGVLPTERYAGQGWGLLQVLEGMPERSSDQEAVKNFAVSAKNVLTNRVRNSPPERHESRWLPGWLDRINTYLQH